MKTATMIDVPPSGFVLYQLYLIVTIIIRDEGCVSFSLWGGKE
jgi:hypothetical protein